MPGRVPRRVNAGSLRRLAWTPNEWLVGMAGPTLLPTRSRPPSVASPRLFQSHRAVGYLVSSPSRVPSSAYGSGVARDQTLEATSNYGRTDNRPPIVENGNAGGSHFGE